MKQSEKIFDGITQVEDELVEDAQSRRFYRRHRGRKRLTQWAALAAAVLILVAGMDWMRNLSGMKDSAGMDSGGAEDNANGEEIGDDGGSDDNGGEWPQYVDFMDAAGPILPLAAEGESDYLTAERELTLDFAAFDQVTTPWQEKGRIQVMDRYTLTNAAIGEQTLTLRFPQISSLMEADPPEITVNGQAAEAQLSVGRDPGLEPGAGWEEWFALLEGEIDEKDGTNPEKIPVVVYTVSGQYGTEGDLSQTLALEVTYDPDQTQLLQYGFDGMQREDENYLASGSLSNGEENWYLIVLGEDVQSAHLQGYEDGGCDPKEKLDTVGGRLTRWETNLKEILSLVARNYWEKLSAANTEFPCAMEFEDFWAAVLTDQVWLQAERVPQLEDWFSWSLTSDRLLWWEVEVTVPGEGTLEVSAGYSKTAARNYEDALRGYTVLPFAGSNLAFTSQVAQVINLEELSAAGNLLPGTTELTEKWYQLCVHP